MSKKAQSYWKVNLKYLAILLSIWFLVSFLIGIAFAESLNQFNIAVSIELTASSNEHAVSSIEHTIVIPVELTACAFEHAISSIEITILR